jgi:hypothetical protein
MRRSLGYAVPRRRLTPQHSTDERQTDRNPDRYPDRNRDNPTACTRRPCPCDRPRSRHALLMNAGRSSDSQAQPTACLLASRTASPFRSQWPDNSRPLFPVWEFAWIQRRGRPGIAPEFPVCRSFTAANDRPPDSMAECIGGATTVKLCRSAHHNRHRLTRTRSRRETLPVAQTNRLNL